MKNDLSLHKILINKRVQGWVRPADWLPMPDIPAGEQKAILLVGIYSDVPDMTQMFTVYSGTYTVDWGDGSPPENIIGTSGHAYDYAALPEATLTPDGYKQVIITISCPSFTSLTISNNFKSHFAILDISVRAPSMNGLSIQASYYAQRLRFFGPANLTSLNLNGGAFETVYFEDPNPTKTERWFRNCYRITDIDLNMAGKTITSLERIAEYNYAVKSVNLHGVKVSGTSVAAFYNCSSLEEVLGIDVENATSLSSMFAYCYKLRRANITGIALNISFADCLIHRDELVEIFNNLKTVSGQTITITNNPGAASLTAAERAIATDKGWTITG
ncbi:MAG: hypothetical protein GXY44_15390 [Phycisphaerales bacterium]|nr:hypothetical protein [Phycisphaerales bacterium]